MTGAGLHGRDATDHAFCEWLLSDHPDARAERDWRRAATYQADIDRAAAVRAWADKIGAQPGAGHSPASGSGPGSFMDTCSRWMPLSDGGRQILVM